MLPTERLKSHRLRFTGELTVEQFGEQCKQEKTWYHSYYFDNGYQVRGDYNIGADILDYGFPDSMAGMRVLDLGTGAGWFAFYFEQLGADVVTVDARGYCDFDIYGRHFYPLVSSEGKEPDRFQEDGTPIYDSPVSGAFWLMRDILKSTVHFVNSRIYDIRPEMFGRRKFDLVFLGAILCHLRDPIGALMAARRVCEGHIIVTTPVVIGEPESEVLPRQYLPYTSIDNISWWLPNEACFRHWFLAAGFRNPNVERSVVLRCDLEHPDETGRVVNADQTLRVGRAHV
jgi:SAM-dependent methyltransferase